jgi:hypothetical protein
MEYIMLSSGVVAYLTVAAVLWSIQEDYKDKANKQDK